ncbi:MAG: hypothetical protein AAF726_16410 [Planctomycetota bacterium]
MDSSANLESYDAHDEPQAAGFDLREIVLYGVGRSRYLVALLASIGAFLGIAYALSIPNTYSANASLRYTPGLRERQFAPEASAGIDVQSTPPSIIAELMLISDPEVFRQAAEQIGVLEILVPADPAQYDTASTNPVTRWIHGFQAKFNELRSPAPPDLTSEAAIAAAAATLRARTTFTPIGQSVVISVSHTSSSKERAVAHLDVILDACIERHREQYHTEEKLLRNQAREGDIYQQLEVARTDFRAYRAECGIDDVDKSLTEVRSRLGDVDEQISAVRTTVASNASELEFLTELIESINPEQEIVEPAIRTVNPRYDAAIADKEQATIELATLQTNGSLTFAERSARKKELELRIAEYEKRLASNDPYVIERPQTVTYQKNPQWVELEREIRVLTGTQRASDARLSGLEGEREELIAELQHVRNCETTYRELRGLIVDLEKDYESVASRNDELSNLMQLDEAGAANLSRYIQPRKPESKDGPPRAKVALGGLGVGLFLGLALAIARQLLDGRIRYPRTIEREFAFPVLSTVPELRRFRRMSTREVSG